MMEPDKLLMEAIKKLSEFTNETGCGVCKRYAERIISAIDDLKAIYTYGEKFVEELRSREGLKNLDKTIAELGTILGKRMEQPQPIVRENVIPDLIDVMEFLEDLASLFPIPLPFRRKKLL